MFTLLNVSDIYNNLTLIMACVVGDLVTHLVFLVFAFVRTNWVIENMVMVVIRICLSLDPGDSTIYETEGQ